MTNTGQIEMYPRTMHSGLEKQMTSYELLAADRSAAIQNDAAQRARRVALLVGATRSSRPDAEPRRLRARLRLGVSGPA